MSRTINGKSFETVLQELKEPFEYVWLDYNQHKYIPTTEIEKRLEDVLGLNWTFELIDKPEFVRIQEANSKAETIKIVCTGCISIFDDNGNLVAKRTQGGGADVIFLKENGKIKDLSSDYKSAITDAEKKCAKAFGVGRYLDDKKNDEKKQPYKPDNNTGKGTTTNLPKTGGKGATTNPPKTEGKNTSSNSSGTTTNNAEKVVQLKLLSKGKSNTRGLNFAVVDKDGRKGTMIIWKNVELYNNQLKIQKLNNLPIETVVNVKCLEKTYGQQLQFNCVDIAV